MKLRLSLFSSIISLSLFAQEKEIKLASDVWPPFTNEEGEKAVALDIVRTAFDRINEKQQIQILDFEEVIAGIKSGRYDGSGALWRTSDREEMMFFSDPYLQNRLVLVGLKGKDVSFTNEEQLGTSRIGLIKDYGYDESLLGSETLQLVFSHNDQENLELLFEGKIDYMLVDALEIQYLMEVQMNDVHELLAVAESPFEIKPLHLAIRKDVPNAEEIIRRFNEEIKAMQMDGTYHDILGLNWLKVDVDGDGDHEIVLSGNQAGPDAPPSTYALFHPEVFDPSQTETYHIDGAVYEDWESVPAHYKEKMPSPKTNNSGSGLIMKF